MNCIRCISCFCECIGINATSIFISNVASNSRINSIDCTNCSTTCTSCITRNTCTIICIIAINSSIYYMNDTFNIALNVRCRTINTTAVAFCCAITSCFCCIICYKWISYANITCLQTKTRNTCTICIRNALFCGCFNNIVCNARIGYSKRTIAKQCITR